MIALLAAPTAVLTLIPEVKGLPAPHPYGISPDGGTVVGGFSPANGFRYDVGSRRLSRLSPGGRALYANAASNGGRKIVGMEKNAFVLSAGDLQSLDPLPGDAASVASAISLDGTTVVGYSQSERGTFRAVRWKGGHASILKRLPGYPDMHARGVDKGGMVAVGTAYDGSKAVRGFLWTEFLGTRLLPIPAWAKESSAEALTPDARFGVGSVSSRAKTNAARWTFAKDLVVALPNLPGTPTGTALAVDPSGRYIGGFSGDKAAVWDSAGRVLTLQGFLASRGANVGGWTFEQIVGMGRRGNRVTITGWGSRNKRAAGFVATFTE